MAIDVYLQLEGIKGESQDSAHQGWIECEGLHYAIQQPTSATASTAGGHTAGRAELSPISFHKIVDVSSPLLAQTCAMGKTIQRARIEFFRADGAGKPIKYYQIELENVLITTVAPAVGAGDLMRESVSLRFAQVKWQYTQQKTGGGAWGNTAGGWNLAKNQVA